MRFAKVFFATLFGVVFFVTLFKVLFFMLMAAMVVGGIFLASRAFGYRRHVPQWAPDYTRSAPFGQPFQPFEQPLNPRWQQRPNAPGKRIEVL